MLSVSIINVKCGVNRTHETVKNLYCINVKSNSLKHLHFSQAANWYKRRSWLLCLEVADKVLITAVLWN